MAKRKPKKDYQEILDKALSKDYEGTKEQRQEDICESWNQLHNLSDKKTQQKNGIVYTPVEVVDFILKSIEILTEKEFGVTLDDEKVEVLDPFAGTGIFGARYADLGHDTDNLTCYELDPETAEIANKNISISAGKEFDNCLALDTFQLYEDGLVKPND